MSAAATSGATVSCPYYNAMLGEGWACLTSTNQRGVTAGWTTNEITITGDAVLNFETFKCAIKDTDTSAGNASANKVVCDIISFTDMSDPITVDLVSQQWLKSFIDAEYIVTDSYHGLVFSIIFNKPFYLLYNEFRGNARFDSLLHVLNIKDQSYNWEEINSIIENERNKSIAFIKDALELKA